MEAMNGAIFYSVDRTSQNAVTSVIFKPNEDMKEVQAPIHVT